MGRAVAGNGRIISGEISVLYYAHHHALALDIHTRSILHQAVLDRELALAWVVSLPHGSAVYFQLGACGEDRCLGNGLIYVLLASLSVVEIASSCRAT